MEADSEILVLWVPMEKDRLDEATITKLSSRGPGVGVARQGLAHMRRRWGGWGGLTGSGCKFIKFSKLWTVDLPCGDRVYLTMTLIDCERECDPGTSPIGKRAQKTHGKSRLKL